MKRKNLKKSVINKEENISENKTKCRCGHTVLIKASSGEKICSNCGHIVKNRSIGRFRYLYYEERNKLNDN